MTQAGTDAAALRERLERTTAWREASTGAEALAAALAVANGAAPEQLQRLERATRIVIGGAGSSYYVAQLTAAAMRQVGRLPAVAAPLSEVLLRPEGVFGPGPAGDQPVIVVSRSGTTTEAISVVEAVRRAGHHVLALTCRPESLMARLADTSLAVPEGDERAIVMTRSFVALSSALLGLLARVAQDGRFSADLERLPEGWVETAGFVDVALELALANPSRVVVLGGGPAFGLANEAVLKLTETSQVPAAAYEPLEFRHGPISVCESGVLVVGLLGGSSAEAEGRVLDESAALGARTWVLGPEGPGRGLHEVARLPLLLHPLQALALGVALRRGADPEAPRHLDQVVVLDADQADPG